MLSLLFEENSNLFSYFTHFDGFVFPLKAEYFGNDDMEKSKRESSLQAVEH